MRQVAGGIQLACPVGAVNSEGLLWRSFHLRTILVVLMNQDALSVIKTICLLCAFLLGKPVVLGALSVAQGHSNRAPPFHPWSRMHWGGMEVPRAVVCLCFQEVGET